MKVVTQDDRKAGQQRLQILAYGMPGSGKTWLCASAADHPSTAPVLYCDYYGMSESLARREFKPGTFMHLRIEAMSDFNTLLDWLLHPDQDNQLHELCRRAECEWPKTIAIDSVTELQRSEILRYAGLKPGARPKMDGLGRPKIQDWGSILDEFVMFGLWHYKRIGYHVIMTCLEKTDYEESVDAKGRKIQVPAGTIPALQGKAAKELPSMAMTVMHMEQESYGQTTTKYGEREPWYCTGRTHTMNKVFARDHTGLLPAEIPNPTVPRLMQYIGG